MGPLLKKNKNFKMVAAEHESKRGCLWGQGLRDRLAEVGRPAAWGGFPGRARAKPPMRGWSRAAGGSAEGPPGWSGEDAGPLPFLQALACLLTLLGLFLFRSFSCLRILAVHLSDGLQIPLPHTPFVFL